MVITRAFFVLALATSFPALAAAAIVPLAQLRQVVAGGSIATADESVTFYESIPAEDFGAFDDSTGLALRTEFGAATADGFTRQVSSIGPNEIALFGSADSFVYAPYEQDTAYASTVSDFSVRFQLTEPGAFRLKVSGFASNAASSTMTLQDAADEVLVSYDATLVPSMEELLHLPAGEYSLGASATSSGFFEYGSGQPDGRSEIDVSFLQVPEPASWYLALAGVAACIAISKSLR